MRSRTWLAIVGSLVLPVALSAQADPRLQRVAPEARAEVTAELDRRPRSDRPS